MKRRICDYFVPYEGSARLKMVKLFLQQLERPEGDCSKEKKSKMFNFHGRNVQIKLNIFMLYWDEVQQFQRTDQNMKFVNHYFTNFML